MPSVFFYRSALPVHTFEGRDTNADGNPNDITATAYRYTGLNDSGVATFDEMGPCETVNCSRRAPFSQLNLRVSREFPFWGVSRVEAIAEVFNVFNAKNPFIPLTTQRRLGCRRPAWLLHAADRVRGRRPAARTARRPDRLPAHFLINDAHCHFFSPYFFQTLDKDPSSVYRRLQWDDPGDSERLADRWIREMDANGVDRAALIASVPGDEASVAAAVARHPGRIVGFFMVDPARADAPGRTRRALTEQGLTGVCLFPAMHHVPLEDGAHLRVVQAASECPGAVVFVHCGRLSVGVREKLGLPSRFDFALGDPIALSRAGSWPSRTCRSSFRTSGPDGSTTCSRRSTPAANVHLDTSSSNSWIRDVPGSRPRPVFESALAAAGATRLLFGTDSSFFPRGWQRGIYEQQQATLDELGVSDEDKTLIFGGNFDRLFPP